MFLTKSLQTGIPAASQHLSLFGGSEIINGNLTLSDAGVSENSMVLVRLVEIVENNPETSSCVLAKRRLLCLPLPSNPMPSRPCWALLPEGKSKPGCEEQQSQKTG